MFVFERGRVNEADVCEVVNIYLFHGAYSVPSENIGPIKTAVPQGSAFYQTRTAVTTRLEQGQNMTWFCMI